MVCKATAVRNGAQAASYFEADNYYAKDSDQAPSDWQGLLAAELGFAGKVDKRDFLTALNGTLPNGEEIQRGAGAKHRPATDLTFSAPKTVSLIAFGAGDARVIGAHQQAVTAAMAWAEKNLITARVTTDGKTEAINTGKMLAARFLHDASRNLDPQLHDHFLVLNATRGPDGKLRAIDNHKLFEGQKLLGAMYHAELQRNLENLGYRTEATFGAKNGEFEIVGIDADYIESKSSRRAAIIEALEKRGIDPATATPRQLDTAALDTRKAKGDVDHEKLHDDWRREFAAAMPAFEQPVGLSAADIAARDAARADAVNAALNWAIEHHFECSNAIKREELIRTAVAESHGTTVAAIEAEFDRREAVGDLIRDAKRYTTREAIEREVFMLDTVKGGRGSKASIYSAEAAHALLADQPLNAGQKQAAGMIMCSEDPFTLIQGVAGSGKTHMLKVARPILEGRGYQLIGVAPSHQAASELRAAMGVGMTVQSFNQSPSIHKDLNEKSIVVMDEAGLADTNTMADFARIIRQTGARAVVIGDQRQYKAVAAGNPFLLLQERGIQMAEMNETRRQAPNPKLLEIVNLAAEGKPHEALARLPIIEIKNDAERHEALATDYLKTRAELAERAKAGDCDAARGVILLTGCNADRRALNDKIRGKLGLKGLGKEVTVLDRADLTAAEQKRIGSYQVGQMLKFSKGYRKLGLSAGEVLSVERVERSGIILKHQDGREVTFQPNRLNPENWQVLRAEKLEFAVGDEIRFRQNQKAGDGKDAGYLYNTNDKGVVTGIDPEMRTMTIHNGSNGRDVTLSLDAPQFVTHAYAMTGHSAQGATVHTALCDFRGAAPTTSCESLYTNISRATTEVRVVTDNREALERNADRAIDKPNALDVVGNRLDGSAPSFSESQSGNHQGESPMENSTDNTHQPISEQIAQDREVKDKQENKEYMAWADGAARRNTAEMAAEEAAAERSSHQEAEIDSPEAAKKTRSQSGIQWGADGDSYTSKEGNVFVRDANGDFVSDASINATRGVKNGEKAVTSWEDVRDPSEDAHPDQIDQVEVGRLETELGQAQHDAELGNPDRQFVAEHQQGVVKGAEAIEKAGSYSQEQGWTQPQASADMAMDLNR